MNQQAPIKKLKTDRSFIMYLILSLVTCGIYSIVIFTMYSSDINIIASRYDGKKTMNFCLMAFVLSPITLGIYCFIWYHQFSNRIGNELKRRNIAYDFSAKTFWLWTLLGSLILIGPMVYIAKLIKAMNLLSESYNQYG